MSEMDCSGHAGHKHYRGGIMDGHVAHLTQVAPNEFPLSVGTLLRHGQRSWYQRDDAASEGTEVVYRFVGLGREMPDVLKAAHAAERADALGGAAGEVASGGDA